MYRQPPKEEIKKRKRVIVYVLFLAISGLLWLLIKLNNVYTVKMPVTLALSDPPTGVWLEDEYMELRLETELHARGFVLLRVALVNKNEPRIHASLKSLSPRKINQQEYYLTNQSIKSLVAAHLKLNNDEVIVAENEIRIRVNPLTSKKVKIIPNLDITYDRQYGPYKPAAAFPDSIEIFAIRQVLDTLKSITTEKATYKNLRNKIADSLRLIFNHPSMSATTNKVLVYQQVEQFTETKLVVNIDPLEGLAVKLFPNQTQLILNVAVKDFNKLNAADFQVEVDTSGLARRSDWLYLKVSRLPDGIQLVRMEPQKVEYLLTAAR